MPRRSQWVRWLVLALALVCGACRGRARPAVAADWKPSAGAPAEVAALLLLDSKGDGKVVCLPGGEVQSFLPGLALERVFDVAWKRGQMIVGLGAQGLVLVQARGSVRALAKNGRTARFSPDATALAYEVADGKATTYVLDLNSGTLEHLGGLTDPLWEPDSQHLRATMLRYDGERQATSLRARWTRQTGAIDIAGVGSAQIPSPVGGAVAWSEAQPGEPRARCSVFLNARGGVKHSVLGRFCMGMADERGVRWSSDGYWLAFLHPAQRESESAFIDVVSPDGGRSSALSALRARSQPADLAVASGPGPVWFDWSPSGRLLTVSDGVGELRVYDFETQTIMALGQGRGPAWSPGGTYLSILAGGDATNTSFVLTGPRIGERIALGQARESRWLPAEACAGPGSPR
jgi:hypothetical protein